MLMLLSISKNAKKSIKKVPYIVGENQWNTIYGTNGADATAWNFLILITR